MPTIKVDLKRIVHSWFEKTDAIHFIPLRDLEEWYQSLNPSFVTRMKSYMAVMFEFDDDDSERIICEWGARHETLLAYVFPDVYERVVEYPVSFVVFALCYAIYKGRTCQDRAYFANIQLMQMPTLFSSEDAMVVALEAIQNQAEIVEVYS